MMNSRLTAFVILLSIGCVGISAKTHSSSWRQASEKELTSLIPARAPVISERIETEARTASGVTDGQGKFIAAVVLITAGYSAEGKYSHFFITQVPVKIGDMDLKTGEYVFGYKRADDESLEVKFYQARTGNLLGSIKAQIGVKSGPIHSLLITPPNGDKFTVQIGRYAFECKLAG
jgi:hypothetical protein